MTRALTTLLLVSACATVQHRGAPASPVEVEVVSESQVTPSPSVDPAVRGHEFRGLTEAQRDVVIETGPRTNIRVRSAPHTDASSDPAADRARYGLIELEL